MSKIWSALVAVVTLFIETIKSAVYNLRQQTALREAAEKRTATLEEERLRTIEAQIAKDIREGTEVLRSANPSAAASDFLRESFPPKDN